MDAKGASAGPDDFQTVGTYAAVHDARDSEALAQGRQMSHDQLIAMTGDQRRGPVQWRQVPARQGIELLDELEAASYRTDGDRGGYDDLKRYLRQFPDGALIIATALVDDREHSHG